MMDLALASSKEHVLPGGKRFRKQIGGVVLKGAWAKQQDHELFVGC